MRITNGLRFFFGFTTVATLTATFLACSGSDDQDVIAEDSGVPDTYRPDTGAPDTSRPDTGADTGPSQDSGPGFDAGPPVVLDGGPLYEGGVKCVAGGQVEEEPNDNEGEANDLRYADAACTGSGCSRCGVIMGSIDVDAGVDAGLDAGGLDPEFVSFVLHETAKQFYVQFGGDVTLEVNVDGKGPYYISQTQTPDGGLPFVRDKTYYVKVTPNKNARTEWRVTLFEIAK